MASPADAVSPMPSAVVTETPTKAAAVAGSTTDDTATLSTQDSGTFLNGTSPPLPPAPKDREGYTEQTSSLELRKNRIVHNRIVTIVPPKPEPWWSPKKSTPKKGKETNNPNPLELALSPFKDMIDHISQHGENKKKEKAKSEAQAKEEARKRVEKVTGQVSDVAAELVFVHGSCASSSQFDRLLSALWERIHDTDDTTSSNNIGKIRCHLYDSVGCGSSKHDPSDWNAYNSDEQMKDLEEVVRSVAASSTSSTPVYLVGHSYGASQVIRLLPLLPESISSCIEGLILISGALANGPSDVPNDNGPCIFCLPVFFLNILQPKVNDVFLEKAYHPTTDEGLIVESRKTCESNDMRMVKAFYRQWKWATKDDAAKVNVSKVVVVHGAEDKLIVPAAGEHLNDILPNSEYKVIKDASHQLMEEQPGAVADILLEVLSKKA